MMTNTPLNYLWEDNFGVWFAFDGETPDSSICTGEGRTKRAALEDYWWCRNKGHEVYITEGEEGEWEVQLSDSYSIIVGTFERAFEYAVTNGYRPIVSNS
jgi:hypothetical protein